MGWDIIRTKRLSDIKLDTIKARVMQNNPQHVRDMEDRQVQDNNNDNETQDIPRENSTPSQNTTEACQDEEVLTMKTEILRKWVLLKEQHIGERPSLPKTRKDQHVCGAMKLLKRLLKKSKRSTHLSP